MDSKQEGLDEIRASYIKYSEEIDKCRYNHYENNIKATPTTLKWLKKLHDAVWKKVDKLQSEVPAGNEHHDRCTVMKAKLMIMDSQLLYLDLADKQNMNKLKASSENVLTMLAPLIAEKNKIPMAIETATLAYMNKINAAKSLNDHDEEPVYEICEQGNALYERFIASGYKMEDAWGAKRIFGISDEDAEKLSNDFKSYHRNDNLESAMKPMWWQLGQKYAQDPDLCNLCLKYSLPSLSITFSVMREALKRTSLDMMSTIIICVVEVAQMLMFAKSYKQANELLAVAMYYSVKVDRKCTCPTHTKKHFKHHQGQLCFSFARLAECVAGLSLDYIENSIGNENTYSRLDIVNIMNQSDSKPALATEMMEEGVEVYLNDIPTKLIDNVEDIKRVFRKGLMWNKRATDLMEKDQNEMFLKVQKEKLRVLLHQMG